MGINSVIHHLLLLQHLKVILEELVVVPTKTLPVVVVEVVQVVLVKMALLDLVFLDLVDLENKFHPHFKSHHLVMEQLDLDLALLLDGGLLVGVVLETKMLTALKDQKVKVVDQGLLLMVGLVLVLVHIVQIQQLQELVLKQIVDLEAVAVDHHQNQVVLVDLVLS